MEHPHIEIPKFLSHLPVYVGFPIPFTTFVHEGKPDFRVTDMEKWDACVRSQLCGICGRKLGEYSYFIGGPISVENRLFFDPAMHKDCAEYAARICPFLNGRKTEYRPLTNEPPEGFSVEKREMVSDIRPDKLFILKARTVKVGMTYVQEKLLIKAPPWSGVREF